MATNSAWRVPCGEHVSYEAATACTRESELAYIQATICVVHAPSDDFSVADKDAAHGCFVVGEGQFRLFAAQHLCGPRYGRIIFSWPRKARGVGDSKLTMLIAWRIKRS